VLDVGCGCGQTTLQLADRVGTEGSVTGVDLSALMLERAEQRAAEAGLENVLFEQADAQIHPFAPASFDVVYSRFGMMFFADSAAAFVNLRNALQPGGRLAFVCWRHMQDNPWMLVPLTAAGEIIPLPPRPAPGAPGPFALADDARLRSILRAADFVDVDIQAFDTEVAVGGPADLDATVDFVLQMGPTGAALRESGNANRPQVANAVRNALATYATPQGVRMPASAWIVTGRKP